MKLIALNLLAGIAVMTLVACGVPGQEPAATTQIVTQCEAQCAQLGFDFDFAKICPDATKDECICQVRRR
jgi:hypothetical protein